MAYSNIALWLLHIEDYSEVSKPQRIALGKQRTALSTEYVSRVLKKLLHPPSSEVNSIERAGERCSWPGGCQPVATPRAQRLRQHCKGLYEVHAGRIE